MAISLPAGSGSARNLASRSRQKAEFVSIAPFAIHQEVRLRPVHDTGARRELGDYPNISRRELPLLREELGASGADFCRGLIVALFCPKRRPFWDIGIAEQPRGPPSLSWGEERTKILLLACCYQEVAPAVAQGFTQFKSPRLRSTPSRFPRTGRASLGWTFALRRRRHCGVLAIPKRTFCTYTANIARAAPRQPFMLSELGPAASGFQDCSIRPPTDVARATALT